MFEITLLLGTIAGVLSTILYLPQVYHMIKLKSGRDVSYIYLFMQICASCVWVTYGYYLSSYPIMIFDSSILVITFIMIYIKHKYAQLNNTNNNDITNL